MELIYTPAEFVSVFNQSIEYSFSVVIIEGEVTNFRVAKGKWVYFDIKDNEATLRCFGTIYILPGPLEDGMLVRVVCTPRLHPLYNLSLTVQSIQPIGDGALARQAELLYKKLEAEGLFEVERKRKIPYPPEHIALVTSTESAAYADFIKITTARWPHMVVDAYDVLVQGSSAPEQIVKVFQHISGSARDYDAVVLIRGGGSAEDLAVFNDERVVRAVASSRVPTMVAIGHETDESLSELASDQRASTPSNAAELLVPNYKDELLWRQNARRQLSTLLSYSLDASSVRIAHHRVRLLGDFEKILRQERENIRIDKERLRILNPIDVLRRGYAIVRSQGEVVRSVTSLRPNDVVQVQLADGSLSAIIVKRGDDEIDKNIS